MVSWPVGPRSPKSANEFVADLASRLAGRVQLTTDGPGAYQPAVEKAFGWNGVDFAQLIKTYANAPDGEHKRRYSPGVCTGAIKNLVMGNPDMDDVSTSYVERSHLSMRMGMRRFTRHTNGFRKKAANHAHAVSLYFMHYNFCRAHMTLTKANGGIKQTPAMAAGITNHVWTVEEILEKMNPEFLLQSN